MGRTDELPEWADEVLFVQYLWEKYGYKTLGDDSDLEDVYRAMKVESAMKKRPQPHA